MIDIQCRGPPSSTSAFEKYSLNLPQFVQLMETFTGEGVSLPELKKLVAFMKKGYVLLEKEKISQMERVNIMALYCGGISSQGNCNLVIA